MQPGDGLFLDTNILLTASDLSRPEHASARRLFSLFRSAGVHAACSGQVLREYLVVATRPAAANGLGLSHLDALRNVEQFARRIVFLEENEAVSLRLRRLVAVQETTGTRIHDANIVATMLTHGVTSLLTQNAEDFAGFPELSIYGITEALRAMPGGS